MVNIMGHERGKLSNHFTDVFKILNKYLSSNILANIVVKDVDLFPILPVTDAITKF